MRVISGTLKGRVLKGPKTHDTRPVLDQVKESLFNILPNPEGLRVLDIFAGTGAIGIEALSRGAQNAVFIEKDSRALRVLLENLTACNLLERVHVLHRSSDLALKILKKKKAEYDWIFCDPPYDRDLVNQTISDPNLLALTTPETLLIVEHSPRERPESKFWQSVDMREYGQTRMSFLRRIQ